MNIFQKDGLTLIEIIISLTIIVILITGIYTALVGSLKSEVQLDEQHKIRRVTNSIIENLKTEKYRTRLNDPDIVWDEDEYNLSEYNINFKDNDVNNTDILINIEKKDFSDNLYFVKITWKNINYSSEILISGD
ncbi:prepilin-type N-terminal cleavage/methylation domain-containing protein [Halanaerobium saccharolyticum]|uniref:Prepilin-type N-terminal cleavage/methylation domain-containing protein n=1 Tax=Halanaerobium saccharolyticum TaxID=43595 RepID=A0A4R6LU94_9FIRM|nr:prepilin-type N-terminal cleavage/methylation domain-containing protein [Halanaerobium saccharolyticum]TDO92257.1 prepilin-type N-terminal cleavage/methylation domain-containing protein [Halanaerobium saccharolyticum]